MLKKIKQKPLRLIYVTIGSLGLFCLLFYGYFAGSHKALATDCDQLRKDSYISNYSFVTNKSSSTLVGQNEPLDLSFTGTVANTPGGDPDWTPCFQSTKYQVNFYSYIYSSINPTQPVVVGNVVITNLNVTPTPAANINTYQVKAGAEVTLKQLIPSVSSFGPGSTLTYTVWIYAYVCASNKCPTTDFLGYSNFGKQSVGIGAADAKTADATTIDKTGFTTSPIIQSGLANAVTNATGDPNTSLAGTLLDFLANFIGTLIQLLTTLIYWLFAYVIAPLIEAVLSIHPYQDIFVQVIYPGWLILRNLSNILFIVILLIIGLATLFQVEKYNYKHLLVQVIIAAVLVNFSLVIGQSVLGIADTVQNQFLPNRTNVVRALGYELMVKPVQQMQIKDASAGGGFANLTLPFFLFALALGAFFSFVAILVFLVVRIVGLWVLLMISPMAYVARILPETEKYATEWWNKFLSYAFITPIFAFFLNMAAVFANSHVLGQGSNLYDTSSISGNVADFVYLTASHVTVLVFLFAGLSFAGSSGVIGAKAMTEFVKKGMNKPFDWMRQGAKWGVRRGAEEFHAQTGIQLNPSIIKKDFQAYSESQRQKRLEKGIGKRTQGIPLGSPRDMFEDYFNWAGVKRMGRFAASGFRGYRHYAGEKEKAEKDYKLAQAKAQSLTDDDVQQNDMDRVRLQAEATEKSSQMQAVDAERDRLQKQIAAKEALANSVSYAEAEKLKEKLKSVDEQKVKISLDQDNINAQLDEINNKLKNDSELKAQFKIGSLSAAEKQKAIDSLEPLKQKVDEYKKKASQRKRPEAYYAMQARHHGVAEEMKKIADVEESDQLIQLYEDAIEQKDATKAEAIIKKLAKDGNFNDLLLARMGETSFDSMKNFFNNDFGKNFGVSDHEKLQVASEVSYMNESNKMYSLARVTSLHNGHMQWASDKEHNSAIVAQIEKIEPQERARNLSRLSFVNEKVDAFGKVHRTIHDAGVRVLQGMNTVDSSNHIRQRMKTHTVESILKADNAGEALGRVGATGAHVETALRAAKAPDAPPLPPMAEAPSVH